MKLDEAFLDAVKQPIYKVWNYIGCDCEQVAQECGERLTNAAAMEGCLDANRLSMCVGEVTAEKLVSQAIQEHGYVKVQKFLCKHIKLC